MTPAQPHTAESIGALLAERHARDFWVPECKDGPTHGANHRRMDGVALITTWPLTLTGYEVKVTRADFGRDQKWFDYLPLCHLFYIVCPPQVVKTPDLPEGVGLIWTTVAGTALLAKRRAVRRKVEPAAVNNMLAYMLMNRARPKAEAAGDRDARMERMQREVREAGERDALASFVRGHLRKAWDALHQREARVLGVEQQAERLRERLAAHGIDWQADSWDGSRTAERAIDRLAGCVDPDLPMRLEGAARGLERAARIAREALAERRDAQTKETQP